MSITLESSKGLEGSRFMRKIQCGAIFDTQEAGKKIHGIAVKDCGFQSRSRVFPVSNRENEDSESSSSSIGRNSDVSGKSVVSDSEESEEPEVQSSYKEPLSFMDSLEENLPIRRGISKFYCGKSKSFTSLADAASSSAKDIVKPENPYSRKRRNLLANNIYSDKNRDHPLRNSSCGNFKKFSNSSRSTLALAVTMSNSENHKEEHEPHLPPLHPNITGKSLSKVSMPNYSFSSRSLSLADLHTASSMQSNHPD